MGQGAIVTGKLAAALRRLGFDAVFDTNFSADLTIMEEGYELIERITKGGVLPQITSCSPDGSSSSNTSILICCRTCRPASPRSRCWVLSPRPTTPSAPA